MSTGGGRGKGGCLLIAEGGGDGGDIHVSHLDSLADHRFVEGRPHELLQVSDRDEAASVRVQPLERVKQALLLKHTAHDTKRTTKSIRTIRDVRRFLYNFIPWFSVFTVHTYFIRTWFSFTSSAAPTASMVAARNSR